MYVITILLDQFVGRIAFIDFARNWIAIINWKYMYIPIVSSGTFHGLCRQFIYSNSYVLKVSSF